MKSEFRHGWDKLSGVQEFNVNSVSVISDIDVHGTRRFTNCTVVQVQQPKGRKPHLAVKDESGTTVFEVGARQANAYSALSQLLGDTLSSFSWKEELSYMDDGSTFLRCQAMVGSLRKPATGPSIPRIVLDTETTGLHPQSDEILQLSIIDGDGNTLWNKLYRPLFKTSWPDAQRIHHIKPSDVQDKDFISDDLEEIQDILDRAEQVCAFNAEYDMAFLGEIGLHLDTSKIVDTMREYARKYYGRDYIKLVQAAKECRYRYNAHDALEDCRATLAVQNKVDGRKPSVSRKPSDATARAMVFDRPPLEAKATTANAQSPSPHDQNPDFIQNGNTRAKHSRHIGIPWPVHAILFLFLLFISATGLSLVFDQDHSNPLWAEIVVVLPFIALTILELKNTRKSWNRKHRQKDTKEQAED